MNKKIAEEKERVLSKVEPETEVITEETIRHLPVPVQKWLKKSGIIHKKRISIVRLKQKALMKIKPEQTKWYNANAEQLVTTNAPAYIWTVKVKMNPLITVKGRDKFVDGKGNMLMKMYSLFTLGDDSGEKIDEGSIQRFLAEMVWYPSFATSDYISWEMLDENSAKATISYMGTRGSCNFYFTEQGDVEKITAMRYYGNDEDKRYEWIINIQKYFDVEGLHIPTKMNVVWNLDSGYWKWLKLEVSDFTLE